jgi:cysteine synthase
MKVDDMLSLVGGTPHVRVRCDEPAGAAIHVKLESFNPTGSIKDRAGARLVAEAHRSGRLRPGMTLLDASSGNMGCSIAYFGRLLGFPSRVVSGSKLTEEKRVFMRYFGAEVDQVGDFTIDGNRHCRRLLEAEPDRYCFLDQLHSWTNPQAHYDSTGPEILADFPEVSLLVGSLGTGGSLFGTAQFLKEKRPGLRVVAVQSAVGTRLPGTGSFDEGDYVTPFIQRGYDEGIFDVVEKIDYDSAVAMTKRLREQGVFAGIQTGGVCHAAATVASRLGIQGDVVVLSGDSGWKNMEKLSAI